MPVSQKPKADFTVNRTSGFTTDTFRFIDLSRNGANKWHWTFSPNNIGFLDGYTETSQNPVVFLNSATSYTVTLIATNSEGSDTIRKVDVATAIAYNSPYTQNPIPSGLDIGISRVTLNGMDTTTPLVTPIYHALYNYKQTTLYRGVNYTVSVYRNNNVDPQSMKVWIDYNRNTLFGDASNETIIDEVSQNKVVTSSTFRIPDNSPLGNSRMRIGVSYDNSTLNQDYAAIGVFEDYGILVGHDFVKPVVTLNGPATFKTEVNKPFVDPGATAQDNLEGLVTVNVSGTVDNTKLGYYTLTYTATDLYGNVSEPVIRLVQVEVDQTGPVLVLNGSDSVYLEVFTSYIDQGATATDNLGNNITNMITSSGSVNTNVLGTYQILFKVKDAFGLSSSATRVVTVGDRTSPVITGNAVARHQVGSPFNDVVSVTDNYWSRTGINLRYTGSVNVNVPGNYVITYYATDGSGNEATPFTVTVQVGDLVPPVITLNGLPSMDVDVYTTFTDPGVTATDNYYPNVVVSKTGSVNMTQLGSNTIVYTATDGAGNSASVSRTVHVLDRIAPSISMLGQNPYNVIRFKPYVDPGVQVSDNFYAASSITVTTDVSQVVNHIPGLYHVYYTATDGSGNKATATRTISVSVDGAVGIGEASGSSGFSLYPNPTRGMVKLSWADKDVNTIYVYNVLGSLVTRLDVSANGNEAQIDLSNQKDGIYIIKLQAGEKTMMKKVNLVR
jgi:PKD repeat protein